MLPALLLTMAQMRAFFFFVPAPKRTVLPAPTLLLWGFHHASHISSHLDPVKPELGFGFSLFPKLPGK